MEGDAGSGHYTVSTRLNQAAWLTLSLDLSVLLIIFFSKICLYLHAEEYLCLIHFWSIKARNFPIRFFLPRSESFKI